MSVHHIEKICERCGKLYVAKSGNQKYDIKCGNIVYREQVNEANRIRSEERKQMKQRIYGKIKGKD